MTTLYVLDIPENTSIAKVAAQDPEVRIGHVGPYFEIAAPGVLLIDRRVTDCRHAVWYSAVAGIAGGRVTQHDKDALRVEPA
ncbi:hypothetical protein [Mycobacterium paraintracellulare]|uniref:hypothetical protein n=1 Tax=Mycobacterium paraintracellulare TaxID=1138383 RepID=UPI001926D080|nr:hypothetical protein [Mycobacterium paraintracellulare]BCP14205.1 hypothetical protein MINTM021_11140 [Mycobacterium paraintracellulare]